MEFRILQSEAPPVPQPSCPSLCALWHVYGTQRWRWLNSALIVVAFSAVLILIFSLAVYFLLGYPERKIWINKTFFQWSRENKRLTANTACQTYGFNKVNLYTDHFSVKKDFCFPFLHVVLGLKVSNIMYCTIVRNHSGCYIGCCLKTT